jgi:hypothetical protein
MDDGFLGRKRRINQLIFALSSPFHNEAMVLVSQLDINRPNLNMPPLVIGIKVLEVPLGLGRH